MSGSERGGAMPLYDCVLLLKPTVDRKSVVNVMSTMGRLVCAHKGVITDIKSFGTIYLAYSIKKLSERFDEVHMRACTHTQAHRTAFSAEGKPAILSLP